MPQGLPVSRLIRVSLSLSSALASFANLNSCTLMGESDVIDTTQRMMAFSSLLEVGQMFGVTAPEYLAAEAYFSQVPQPAQVYIGRWAHSPTAGRLLGGALTQAEQAMGNFTTVTNGGFHITVDGGTAVNVTGINLSAAGNLNAVAAAVQAALTSATVAATCVWNGSQFVLKSNSTGATSKVAPTTAPTTGTDLTPLLNTSLATGAVEHDGAAAETALAAVQALDGQGTYWYALNTDACPDMVDADREAIAAYIEASGTTSGNIHIYCFTAQSPVALDPTQSTDVGAVLNAGGYQRTFVQWSSTSHYAACSEIALFMTVDLEGSNTMITAAYKQEPGITPEQLSTNAANALDQKGYNYYAAFNNGVPVLVNGCMICTSITPGGGSDEVFIDEMVGADGLANAIQVDYFNLLAGVPKLPQTDAGSHLGANAIEAACKQFADNGYLGPGQWNSGGFGQITTGSFLPKGYYVYTPPIISQAQADRAARKSVPYQVAAKTAGAIHSADIAVTVNP
jgi:uncharacterized protein DUF3383